MSGYINSRDKKSGGTRRPEVKSGDLKTFHPKLFKGLLHFVLTIYSRPLMAHKATRKIARTF
jgi:AICAR transformylase/IMP cyclohydrolase PurH